MFAPGVVNTFICEGNFVFERKLQSGITRIKNLYSLAGYPCNGLRAPFFLLSLKGLRTIICLFQEVNG